MPQRGSTTREQVDIALGSRTDYMAASIVASRPYKDRQGVNIFFVGMWAEQLPFGLCLKKNC